MRFSPASLESRPGNRCDYCWGCIDLWTLSIVPHLSLPRNPSRVDPVFRTRRLLADTPSEPPPVNRVGMDPSPRHSGDLPAIFPRCDGRTIRWSTRDPLDSQGNRRNSRDWGQSWPAARGRASEAAVCPPAVNFRMRQSLGCDHGSPIKSDVSGETACPVVRPAALRDRL